MASCDPATLLSDGKCFAALPEFELEVLQAQLLYNISSELGSTPGLAALLVEAKCFLAKPEYILAVLQNELLCQINILAS